MYTISNVKHVPYKINSLKNGLCLSLFVKEIYFVIKKTAIFPINLIKRFGLIPKGNQQLL